MRMPWSVLDAQVSALPGPVRAPELAGSTARSHQKERTPALMPGRPEP